MLMALRTAIALLGQAIVLLILMAFAVAFVAVLADLGGAV